MGLEAVMICVDNSEYMRNGDYPPNRLEAQSEAATYVCSSKFSDNRQTEVGLISTAGKHISLCVNLTTEIRKIVNALNTIKVGGKSNFVTSLKTARLALGNRRDKNQKPRIIIFVGSPVECEEKSLAEEGQILRKNGIRVDVINFGTENELNDNREKLSSFVEIVNKSDTSHFLDVPPGPQLLSDMVVSSPILSGGKAGGNVGGNAGGNDDNDAAFQRALALSAQVARDEAQKANKDKPKDDTNMEAEEDEEDIDPDEQALLDHVLKMSMEEDQDMDIEVPKKKEEPKKDKEENKKKDDKSNEDENIDAALADKDFVSALMEETGISMEDEDFDNLMENINDDKDKKDKKDKKK